MILLFSIGTVLWLVFPPNDGYVPSAAMGQPVGAAEEISDEPLFGSEGAKFVAHRGYSGYAPENSIAAFEFAGSMGFWGIETDISQTIDGKFVCMHDETLDRTTDGDGEVGAYTLEQIEEFTIDSGNYLRTTENLKIPRFEEYLDICRQYGCVAVIEIKTISDYDAFLSVIYESGLENRCIITGTLNDLKEVRARNTTIPVMAIGYYPEPYHELLEQIAEIPDNRGVLYNYPQVEENVVKMLHDQNVYCAVWSVDDTEIAEEYVDYGVDFIVTNKIPARLDHMVNTNE